MKNTILLILLAVLVVVTACHKDQPEMNMNISNPCDLAHEVSAEFDILEITGQAGSILEKTTLTDTILHTKSVRFIAKDSTADYTWYIGSEIITERSFVRYFDNSLSGQDITVTLVVKKDPNHFCLPNDDGYDSISKVLHVSQYPILTPPTKDYGSLEGVYRVKSEHKVDSFDVVFDGGHSGATQTFDIYNYDGNGSDCVGNAYINNINYRQVWTTGGTGITVCDYLQGNIHNRIDGVVEMNFTTRAHEGIPIVFYDWKYLGRKLN